MVEKNCQLKIEENILKNNNNNKYNLINLKNPVSRLAYVMAKITLRFNVLFSQFIELYKYHLVTQAQKEDSEYSMVELAARTGLDRRYISRVLKDEELKKTRSKIAMVKQQMRHQCEKNETEYIAKNGGKQSFKNICEQVAAGGLTSHAIAKELIRQGIMVDCGRTYHVIKMTDPVIEQTIDEHFFTRRVFNQLVTICVEKNTKIIDKASLFYPTVKNFGGEDADAQAISDELIKIGCLEDCGEYYHLLNWRYVFSSEVGNFSVISREIDRLVDTMIFNADEPIREDRKLQRTVYSNQIHPSHFSALYKKIEKIYDNQNQAMFDLITSYEKDVPRGTYPNFGVSIYVFNE